MIFDVIKFLFSTISKPKNFKAYSAANLQQKVLCLSIFIKMNDFKQKIIKFRNKTHL